MSAGPTHLDFFCGFGGSSSGLAEAGFELLSAYNHWPTALEVHAANHRQADHVQGDLSGFDMRRLPRADTLWASPECTWHSPAGGRKRVRANDLDLFDDPVPTDAGVRSRATMYDPLRAAEARNFKAVMLENVPEVADWPLFPSWLKMWEALGYSWQIVNASAAHIYSEENDPAGQWRDRIYILFAAKGVTIPLLEPRPLAYCPQCDGLVESRQQWKRQRPIQVGKYGRQYVYVCAANRHAAQIVEPLVLPAASVIDWSDLGTRLGDRDKPLAAATIRRVEVGLRMFANTTVVASHGETWDAASPSHPRHGDADAYHRAWPAEAWPLNARTSTPGDALAFPPFVVDKYDYRGGDERRVRSIEAPLGTVTASPHAQLAVPPYLVEFYGTGTARDVAQPIGAMATAPHHGLAVPPDAFLSRQYGSRGGVGHLNTSVWEPTHPITGSGGNHALVVPQRKRPELAYTGELPFELDDVRFRMLGPREHLRAQRFPDDYDTSAANNGETTKGAGNAVPVNAAHWVGSHVAEALS
jgi:DNA (cytosine-5)-methyltransferase 1